MGITRYELKPCPFCGSPAELEHGSDHHGTWFNLGCSRHYGAKGIDPDNACCGGRLWYTERPEEENKAISVWNKRADHLADKAEAVRVLREALEAMTDFLRHAEWDSHSTEAHVGNLVEQARAALRSEG